MAEFKEYRTALIDGDIIAWRAASIVQAQQLDEVDLIETVGGMVRDWTRRAFCTGTIVCLSGPRDENFRLAHWPLYKAHRKEERPDLMGLAFQAIRESSPVFQRDCLEADDCMGLLATMTLDRVVNPVVVTIDKDLRTVPGWHFNPDKEDFPVQVSPAQAERRFHEQWLTGDSSDGYKGIPKIGPKKAAAILDGQEAAPGGLTRAVLAAYEAAGLDLGYALSMARCARILTADWWDSATRQPVPWLPPQSALEGLQTA